MQQYPEEGPQKYREPCFSSVMARIPFKGVLTLYYLPTSASPAPPTYTRRFGMESVVVRDSSSVGFNELTTLISNGDIPAPLNAATLKNALPHLEMVLQYYKI
jgi:hypothetical protein